MPIYARRSETEFIPAPTGLHQAVCVDVVDLGEQPTKWGAKHKVRIVWQLDARMENGKPYLVSARYTNSLHEKANLCQHLEAWRGRRFTREEAERFDLEKLIGVNCQVQIIHNESEGTTWANVHTIVPLASGMKPIEPVDYVRVVDREDGDKSNPPKPTSGGDVISESQVKKLWAMAWERAQRIGPVQGEDDVIKSIQTDIMHGVKQRFDVEHTAEIKRGDMDNAIQIIETFGEGEVDGSEAPF